MRFVDHKTETLSLDGTPEKRLFWSIMSDYDFRNAVTELIDNSFDIWHKRSPNTRLTVALRIEPERQLVSISDNAGGIPEAELPLLITPGGSNNDPYGRTIGVFGVGTKRAVVAISERITIRTRFAEERSFEINIDPAWLESPDWSLPAYEIPPIGTGRTEIDFSYLRRAVSEDDVADISRHLGETYGLFLKTENCEVLVNGVPVQPVLYDIWSFPPKYQPRNTLFEVSPQSDRSVLVSVEAGLLNDRNPTGDNYGVYVYCNKRLITKELRTREVGYDITSEAGRPHPDASLCRVIVQFEGPARLMPWNSSKTGIVPSSPTFQLAAPTIVQLCAYYTRISRATKGCWDDEVLRYQTGEIEEIQPEAATGTRKLVLPPVPRVKKAAAERLRILNKNVIEVKPYVVGLIESIAAVELVMRQRYQTRTRIAMILLDSTFEIALKEFLVHNKDIFGAKKVNAVLGNRTDVVLLIRSKVQLPDSIFILADHYYEERNKLVHERSTLQVSEEDINRYREAVQSLLTYLYQVLWQT